MEHDLTNQEKLEEVYKMTLENNEILKGIRNRERIGNAFKILYWTIIIGSFVGVYYYISPMLNIVLKNKSKIEEGIKALPGLFPELKTLNGVYDAAKSQMPHDAQMPDNGVVPQ